MGDSPSLTSLLSLPIDAPAPGPASASSSSKPQKSIRGRGKLVPKAVPRRAITSTTTNLETDNQHTHAKSIRGGKTRGAGAKESRFGNRPNHDELAQRASGIFAMGPALMNTTNQQVAREIAQHTNRNNNAQIAYGHNSVKQEQDEKDVGVHEDDYGRLAGWDNMFEQISKDQNAPINIKRTKVKKEAVKDPVPIPKSIVKREGEQEEAMDLHQVIDQAGPHHNIFEAIEGINANHTHFRGDPSDNELMFFFQFPPKMPQFTTPDGEIIDFSGRSQNIDVEKQQDKDGDIEDGDAIKIDAPDTKSIGGEVGKLNVYTDGRVEMVFGECMFDVSTFFTL